jgi:hypothetical protein
MFLDVYVHKVQSSFLEYVYIRIHIYIYTVFKKKHKMKCIQCIFLTESLGGMAVHTYH